MKIFCLRRYLFEEMVENSNIQMVSYGLAKPIQFRSDLLSFMEHFEAEKADFFYFWKDEHLTRDILLKLKSISPKTKFIMFYGDQRGGVPRLIAERRDLIDALLINNEDPMQFKMYNSIGISKVFTLHHCVPKNEFKDFDIPITHDVLFGGNNFNHRKFPLGKFRYDFIMRVKGLYNLIVYGNGWPFKTEKRVPRQQYARVLRRAKINLGSNHYDVLRYYDRRLFECMASGRAHITRYVPGMEKHFENYKHLIWFRSMKEGLNAIQNLIKYPEKREAIAAAGKKLVFEQHSFEQRALDLRKILEAV